MTTQENTESMTSDEQLFEVIVGNIGTTYSGPSRKIALEHYSEYKKQSMYHYGRAADEDVTLMCDGEVLYEYNAMVFPEDEETIPVKDLNVWNAIDKVTCTTTVGARASLMFEQQGKSFTILMNRNHVEEIIAGLQDHLDMVDAPSMSI